MKMSERVAEVNGYIKYKLKEDFFLYKLKKDGKDPNNKKDKSSKGKSILRKKGKKKKAKKKSKKVSFMPELPFPPKEVNSLIS